jgi:hypothetical protein
MPTPVPTPGSQVMLPPTVVPYLAAWWDAADDSTVTLNSGNVSQLRDKSGLGNHLSQATANNQPLYGRGAINGRNALTFSTTNHRLISSSFTVSKPCVFSVWRVRSGYSAGVSKAPIIWDTFSAGNRCVHYVQENSSTAILYAKDDGGSGKVASSSVVFGRTYVSFCASAANVGHSLFLNGVKGIDATAGTTGFSGISLGNLRGNPSPGAPNYNFDGQLCEFIVYSQPPSDAHRIGIERYLGAKWGAVVA